MAKKHVPFQYKLKNIVFKTAKFIFLSFFALLALFPFYWAIMNSVRDNQQIWGNPFGLPRTLEFSNYAQAWTIGNIGLFYVNTLFVSVTAVCLILLVSTMAAYVLARVWPNRILYLFIALGLMIPVHTILAPIFIIFHNIGLSNTFLSLILSYAVMQMALAIFIMRGFLHGLPKEFEEAAAIDGCGRTGAFFRIILPVSTPGLVTVTTLTFLYCWNELLLPLVLVTSTERRVLSLAVQALSGQYLTQYGIQFAGVILMIIPVIIIFLAFQETMIKGMVAGAIKG